MLSRDSGDNSFAHNKLNMLARAGRQQEAEAYATSLLASPSALAPEQRNRVRQVLIGNRIHARDFAAAEHLSRDGLAENPDDANFAWALITAQAEQDHMDQAAATYQHLRPALVSPELVELWLDLLSRRNVTDTDVEAALNAAEQWPGSMAARRLIEGTLAMIAALPPTPAASPNWQPGSAPGTWPGSQPRSASRAAERHVLNRLVSTRSCQRVNCLLRDLPLAGGFPCVHDSCGTWLGPPAVL